MIVRMVNVSLQSAWRAIALGLVILLAGCVTPPPAPPAPEGAPRDFPSIDLDGLTSQAEVYVADASTSTLRAKVYRSGALARLGHDHVLDARQLGGVIWIDTVRSGERAVRAELYLGLANMVVDDPQSRAEESFETEPDDEAREGTRRNMLASLNAATHPFARVELEALLSASVLPLLDSGNEVAVPATATVRVAGGMHELAVSVLVTVRDGVLTGAGEFQIRHTDFGIEPFSVMGGALSVKDEIDLTFRVEARRDENT